MATEGSEAVATSVDDEEQVCDICLDGTVYEDNEILICEKCNVAVHQSCYSVDVIPDDEWFCEVCRAGEDPKETQCEICLHTTGAFKRTEQNDKWAHCLCALWVPEVYCDISKGGVYNTSMIDKARYKISCKLCSNKGAIIQCCHGRCCVGAHPWCAIRHKNGFTHRVVKDPQNPNDLVWEVFCAQHASSVYAPVKPKVKAKRSSMPGNAASTPSDICDSVSRSKKGGKTSKNRCKSNPSKRRGRPPKAPKLAIRDFSDDEADMEFSDDEWATNSQSSTRKRRKSSKRGSGVRRRIGRASAFPGDSSDDEAAEDEEDGDVETNGGLEGYAVCTVSEWPGKAESEPMDLPHFWDVAAMSFPEDHDNEWVEFMASRLLLNPANPFYDDYATYKPPPLGCLKDTIEKLIRGDSDVLSSILSDRDFVALMDPDKRNEFESKIRKLIKDINKIPTVRQEQKRTFEDSTYVDAIRCSSPVDPYPGDGISHTAEVKEKEGPLTPGRRRTSSLVDDGQCFDIGAIAYLTQLEFPFDGFDESDESKPSNIRVVFNGPERKSCIFSIRQRNSILSSASSSSTSDEAQWRRAVYGLDRCSEADTRTEADGNQCESKGYNLGPRAIRRLFTSYGVVGPHTAVNEGCVSDETLASTEIKLDSVQPYSSSNEVILGDRELIPLSEENDEICDLIRHDLAVFRDLTKSMTETVERLLQSDAMTAARQAITRRKQQEIENETVLAAYANQRVWASVCRGLMRGVRDQTKDFNKQQLDVLPASWTIKVEGRPTEEQLEVSKEDISHMDTVCMCCFDGTSSDETNKIIFCDGCNAAMHQMCYGIPVVPEGDFFCDRCQHIIYISQEPDFYYDNEDLKDVVKCCLCPLYHGALKRTTDGRWVHLSCAIWSGGADICDLQSMSPIDISRVPISVPSSPQTLSERPLGGDRTASTPLHTHPLSDTSVSSQTPSSCPTSGPADVATSSNPSIALNVDSTIPPELGMNAVGDACISRGPEPPSQESNVSGGTTNPVASLPVIPEALSHGCTICGKRSGFMTGCVSEDCGKRFHPICAWFAGLYIATEINDPTFLGQSKAGSMYKYPSGVAFTFHCPSHTPAIASRPRDVQRDLRRVYMINELDLCCIPGRAPKRRRQKKKSLNATSGTKRLAGGTKPKDLKPDRYDSEICAICLGPSRKIFSHSPAQRVGRRMKGRDEALGKQDAHAWVVHCIDCGLTVHRRCLVPDAPAPTCVITMPNVLNSLSISDSPQTSLSKPPINLRTGQSPLPTDVHDDPVNPDVQHVSQQQTSSSRPSIKESPVLDLLTGYGDSADTGGEGSFIESKDSKHMDDSSPVPSGTCTPSIQKDTSMRNGCDKSVTSDVQGSENVTSKFISSVTTNSEIDYSSWKCAQCVHKAATTGQVSDEGEPISAPELRCVACPRRGGMFVQHDGKWFHNFCAAHKPIRSGDKNQHAKDGKKQNCSYCNRKTGLSVRCSHPEPCGQHFHPICAARAGDSFMRIRNGVVEQFCSSHTPVGVCRLPNGYWVDTEEVARLRRSLDNALIILDLVRKREKSKKQYYKARGEVFARSIENALRQLKSSRGLLTEQELAHSDVEAVTVDDVLTDIYSDNEQNTTDSPAGFRRDYGRHQKPLSTSHISEGGGELVPHPSKRKRPENYSGKEGLKLYKDDFEEDNFEPEIIPAKKRRGSADISMNEAPIANSSKHHVTDTVPMTVRVELSGQERSYTHCYKQGGYGEYSRKFREDMLKTVDETRESIGIFGSQRGFVDFERKIGAHVDKYLGMTIGEISSALEPETDSKSREEPICETVTRGGRRRSSIDELTTECQQEVKPESVEKKRKRSPNEDSLSVKVSMGQTTEEGSSRRKSKVNKPPVPKLAVNVPLLPHVDFTLVDNIERKFVNTKSDFEKEVRSLVPQLLPSQSESVDWAIVSTTPDDGSSQNLIRLERMLSTILAILSNVSIPCTGVYGNISKPGSSDDCIDALIGRLSANESISDRWWEVLESSTQPRSVPVKRTRRQSARKSKSLSGYGTSSTEGEGTSIPRSEIEEKDSGGVVEEDERKLSEDFNEIPYDALPDYDTLVIHPICLDTMKSKLQSHSYRSFSQFAKDFYEMLSNGRQITVDGSKTWWDTQVLSGLFAYLRQLGLESTPGNCLLRPHTDGGISYAKCIGESSTNAATVRGCTLCEQKWNVSGNFCRTAVSTTTPRSSGRTTSKSSSGLWKWVCTECINTIHTHILGMAVKIYWPDDAKYYDGWIEAYDEVSTEHRVNYSDGEWEFLQLQREDILLRMDGDDYSKLFKVISVSQKSKGKK